jgi:hypothetical protein
VLSQEGLADRAGVNVRTVQRIEDSQPTLPQWLERVAKTLNVEASSLVKEEVMPATEIGSPGVTQSRRLERGRNRLL